MLEVVGYFFRVYGMNFQYLFCKTGEGGLEVLTKYLIVLMDLTIYGLFFRHRIKVWAANLKRGDYYFFLISRTAAKVPGAKNK